MLTILQFLATAAWYCFVIAASLAVLLYIALRVLERIYLKAAEASRIDIAREIESACAWLAREPEASNALRIVADQVLSGGMVDGPELRRGIEEGRAK